MAALQIVLQVSRVLAFLLLSFRLIYPTPLDAPVNPQCASCTDYEKVYRWEIACEIGTYFVIAISLALIILMSRCEIKPINEAGTKPEVVQVDCPLPVNGTPPPPYDESAPPAYIAILDNEEKHKGELGVFMVPIHNIPCVPAKKEKDISDIV